MLYYDNPYCREFTTRVISCVPHGNSYAVTLSDTAFYPGGGGQPADTGTLDGVHAEGTDGPALLCAQPFVVGQTVQGKIDWEPRFIRMQQHTAEHLLSGLLYRKFGYHNTGFHMNPERVQMDTDGAVRPEQLPELEQELNEAIWANVPVRCWYPDEAELARIDYRAKGTLHGAVRLVAIGDYDVCACCALHVARTGEAGPVKLWSAVPFRGGTRIEMSAGKPALARLNAVFAQAESAGQRLSVPPEGIADAAVQLREKLEDSRAQAAALRKKREQTLIAALQKSGAGDLALLCGDVDPIRSAEQLASPGQRAACVSDGRWCVAVPDGDGREITKALSARFGARGGGKPALQCGSVKAAPSEVAAFLANLGFSVMCEE